MKVMSVILSMKEHHGGPPAVLNNQIKVINKDQKIVSIFKLSRISSFFLMKCILFKSYRLRIYNFLKKFHLVHFHEIWSIKVMLLVYLCNKLLIKHFFVGHGYLDSWSINQGKIKKKIFLKFFLQPAYNSASASFFSSLEEYIEASKNINVHNPFIIPNGIPIEQFKKRDLENKKKKKILFFGRIHKKKGLDLLLKTIKKLPDDYFDHFSFDITGPGEIKDINKLKKLITNLSLEEKVKYNEPIYGSKKISYLQEHDIFLLPSFEEGDSIALKEALASYLPVIISKQCRLDIVQKYNAGLVIETNENSLYEALIKLKSLNIIQMGYQARKLIEDNYDNIYCSKRLQIIYQDIFNETQKSSDWI